MTKKDFILMVTLFLIAACLLLNLFGDRIGLFDTQKAAAVTTQKLIFRGNGIAITCSSDGRYVYAAGSGTILRSTDYGSNGSWEIVAEN